MDMGLIRSAALLHDVVRERRTCIDGGAGILVRKATPWWPMSSGITTTWRRILDETAVVYLADKLIQGREKCP